MTIEWAQIEHEWLGVAGQPEEPSVVEALNRVASVLGPTFAMPRSDPGQLAPGPYPMMSIALVGHELAGLSGVPETDHLVARLRRNDGAAWAELLAIRVARGPNLLGQVELEPAAAVGARQRRPDFRIREGEGSEWTYVEVTAPTDSNERRRLQALLEELTSVLDAEPAPYVLEIILRREPLAVEMPELTDLMRNLAHSRDPDTIDLPHGLGIALANQDEAAVICVTDRGEPPTSRLARAQFLLKADGSASRLTLRIAYRDERAARYLDTKARQLPRGVPGLVMVEVGKVVTARSAWEALVRRRFQPSLNTHVSAAVLFESGVIPGDVMEARIAAKLLLNEHGAAPIPGWLERNVEAWPDELLPPPAEVGGGAAR